MIAWKRTDCKRCGLSAFPAPGLRTSGLSAPGGNVLLSPACASFDMFEDYEQRGRVFKDIVQKL